MSQDPTPPSPLAPPNIYYTATKHGKLRTISATSPEEAADNYAQCYQCFGEIVTMDIRTGEKTLHPPRKYLFNVGKARYPYLTIEATSYAGAAAAYAVRFCAFDTALDVSLESFCALDFKTVAVTQTPPGTMLPSTFLDATALRLLVDWMAGCDERLWSPEHPKKPPTLGHILALRTLCEHHNVDRPDHLHPTTLEAWRIAAQTRTF